MRPPKFSAGGNAPRTPSAQSSGPAPASAYTRSSAPTPVLLLVQGSSAEGGRRRAHNRWRRRSPARRRADSSELWSAHKRTVHEGAGGRGRLECARALPVSQAACFVGKQVWVRRYPDARRATKAESCGASGASNRPTEFSRANDELWSGGDPDGLAAITASSRPPTPADNCRADRPGSEAFNPAKR